MVFNIPAISGSNSPPIKPEDQTLPVGPKKSEVSGSPEPPDVPKTTGNYVISEEALSDWSTEKLLEFLKTLESKSVLLEIKTLKLNDKSLKAEDLNLILLSLARLGSSNILKLSLQNNEIGDDGAQAIASCENLRNLTSLDLGRNKINATGARAVASSTILRSLTSLSLENNFVSDDGARAIAESENLRSLTRLGLANNGIGNDGARAVANSMNLRDLTLLDLKKNHNMSFMTKLVIWFSVQRQGRGRVLV